MATRSAVPTHSIAAPQDPAGSEPQDVRRGRRGIRARRIGLSARGISLGVLGLAALGLGSAARYPGLIGLGIAALVAVAVALIGVVSKRGVTIRRELPAGQLRRLDVVEAAVSPSPRRGSGRGDEIELIERIGGVALPPTKMVIGEKGAALRYRVPTTMPGLLTLGPTELRYFGFAGLARMRLRDSSTSDLLVLARMLPVRIPDNGALPVDTIHGDEIEGGGTELRSLRPYIPGDDIRKVNARISARMGRLMIRQDSEPAISAVTIVLDNHPGCPDGCYAEMLDVATSLAGAAVRQGLPVRWTGRGLDGAADVDSDGLGVTEGNLARLVRTDDIVPRIGTSDLTVVIAGSDALPGHLMDALVAADRRGLFVVVRISSAGAAAGSTGNAGGGSADAEGGGEVESASTDRTGAVLISAPSAETVLRRFAQLGQLAMSR